MALVISSIGPPPPAREEAHGLTPVTSRQSPAPTALQSVCMSISRRQFMQGTAASAVAPMLLLGGDSATLGSGSHVYEFVPDWGKLPNGVPSGYTHGVAIDSHPRTPLPNRTIDP